MWLKSSGANDPGNAVPSSLMANQLISIVIPAYNEARVLMEFQRRLSAVIDSIGFDAEIIFVNDGSTDDTLGIMEALRDRDPRVAIVDLSRNFGKEIALTAGLDHSRGDAVVVIDADLQDPPELIPDLLSGWKDGYDVVYAKRMARTGEGVLKRTTAYLFYRVLQHMSPILIPADTGDFRLLSRRAVDAIAQIRERHRFMKGLFAWIGYPQKEIYYKRDQRFAGKTKWNYWKLWNFAIEGITSFTTSPLKIASYLGVTTAVFAFIYGVRVIYKTLLYGDPVAGYPSLMVVLLFTGGVQLITLGVIGEYLARVFDEGKQRPLYFLKNFSPSKQGRL